VIVLSEKAQLNGPLIPFSQISQEPAKKGGSLDLWSTVRVIHRRNRSHAYQRCIRSTYVFLSKSLRCSFRISIMAPQTRPETELANSKLLMSPQHLRALAVPNIKQHQPPQGWARIFGRKPSIIPMISYRLNAQIGLSRNRSVISRWGQPTPPKGCLYSAKHLLGTN
jgi:hypothetical protein